MTFIPRHPVIQDQFCSYTQTTTGSGGTGTGATIAEAGSVVIITDYGTAWSELDRTIVRRVETGDAAGTLPHGLLMQKIKTGYEAVHPAGYVLRKDMGSSDAIALPKYTSGSIVGTRTVPVGVGMLGIWETTHYVYSGANGFAGGALLYACNEGTVGATGDSVITAVMAIVEKGLTDAEATAGTKALRIKLLI